MDGSWERRDGEEGMPGRASMAGWGMCGAVHRNKGSRWFWGPQGQEAWVWIWVWVWGGASDRPVCDRLSLWCLSSLLLLTWEGMGK